MGQSAKTDRNDPEEISTAAKKPKEDREASLEEFIPPVRSRGVPPPPTLLERLDRDFPRLSTKASEKTSEERLAGTKTFVSLVHDKRSTQTPRDGWKQAPADVEGKAAALKLSKARKKQARVRVTSKIDLIAPKQLMQS